MAAATFSLDPLCCSLLATAGLYLLTIFDSMATATIDAELTYPFCTHFSSHVVMLHALQLDDFGPTSAFFLFFENS